MWSDEIDKVARNAADSTGPAYNEKAWDKMEVLLNEHLPQKKKRRGFIFLLFFLLLGGTFVYFIAERNNTTSLADTGSKPDNITSPADQQPVNSNGTTGNTISAPPVPVTNDQSAPTLSTNNTSSSSSTIFNGNQHTSPVSTPVSKTSKNSNVTPDKQSFLPQYDQTAGIPGNNTTSSTIPAEQNLRSPSPLLNGSLIPDLQRKKPVLWNKDINPPLASTAPERKKPVTRKSDLFSLGFSFGPDLSSIDASKPGKWKMQYGLTLDIAVSKRIHFTTGLLASRKIYSVDPADYRRDLSGMFYNLNRVDGDCKVYEIPASLSYHFIANQQQNVFVSGGLSTYLMKKETYGYSFKDMMGQPQYQRYSMSNKNASVFSVLSLSAGYQHHISDRLSVKAEPYVKIPLNGIGYGNVKLNSGGVLITTGFKFGKRN